MLLAIILNNLSQADAAVLDFAEAFEKVPHRHLRAKLKWCNLSQQVIGWIESLLCSPARRVIVDVTGSLCLNRYPTQGTDLGLLLFLMFSNNVTEDAS